MPPPPPIPKTTGLTPFGRHVLFGLVLLGALVMLGVFVAIPVFDAMFVDYGKDLPTVTKIILEIRYLFLIAGAASGFFAYLVLYRRRDRLSHPLWLLSILGFEYLLFIIAASSLFMPILQLATTSPVK